MKLLLTSNGLSNKSIADAFIKLVGKPAEDIKVAFIITAGLINGGNKHWLINDLGNIQKLGCYVDIVDIAQLSKDEWYPRVELCDVIFVGGGNGFYLSYCMQKSGMLDALPELLNTRIYAGISAGSMIACQSLALASDALKNPKAFKDGDYDLLGPKGRASGKTLKFADIIFRPHLNSRHFSLVRKDFLEEKVKSLDYPVYAIDDNSALEVVDGLVEVVSEGEWLLFNEK